jgi:two-component system cell cycle sensor histidine kinase PleC
VWFDPQDGLAITVSDSGIGIAPEDLDRVLEPFAQVDSSLSRSHSGTGLGLPIVKRMMELHHGTLSLASSIGSGTSATVRFPAERAVHQQPLRAPLLTA